MPVETPISLKGIIPVLARPAVYGLVRMMPVKYAKIPILRRLAPRVLSKELQVQFDRIGGARDEHDKWMASDRASSALDRFGIPHVAPQADSETWRAFLSRVIRELDEGKISEAINLMSDRDLIFWEHSVDRIAQHGGEQSNAPGEAPRSDYDTIGPAGVALEPVSPADDDAMALADAIAKAWTIKEICELPEFEALARDRPQDIYRRVAEHIFDGHDSSLSIRGVIGDPPLEQTVESLEKYTFSDDLTEMVYLFDEKRRYRDLRVQWSDIETSILRRTEPDAFSGEADN